MCIYDDDDDRRKGARHRGNKSFWEFIVVVAEQEEEGENFGKIYQSDLDYYWFVFLWVNLVYWSN